MHAPSQCRHRKGGAAVFALAYLPPPANLLAAGLSQIDTDFDSVQLWELPGSGTTAPAAPATLEKVNLASARLSFCCILLSMC